MATWMWLNLGLGAVFVLAIAGIPLWMVIRRPDVRHELEQDLQHAVRAVHVPAPRAEAGRGPRTAYPVYAGRGGRPQPWTEPSS